MQISVSTAAVRRAKLGVFLAKRCFGTTSTAAVPGVADQNSTRETTGQSPTRSPQFDFPARDKHPGRPGTARTPRVVRKVSARAASAPPRTRGKKPGGEDGSGTLFTSPPRAPDAQFPRCFSPQRRSTASPACFLASVRCASRTCAYWPRGAPVPAIDPHPGFRPLEGNFLVNVWWVFSERFRATGARGVRPARELILTPVSSG